MVLRLPRGLRRRFAPSAFVRRLVSLRLYPRAARMRHGVAITQVN